MGGVLIPPLMHTKEGLCPVRPLLISQVKALGVEGDIRVTTPKAVRECIGGMFGSHLVSDLGGPWEVGQHQGVVLVWAE